MWLKGNVEQLTDVTSWMRRNLAGFLFVLGAFTVMLILIFAAVHSYRKKTQKHVVSQNGMALNRDHIAQTEWARAARMMKHEPHLLGLWEHTSYALRSSWMQ